MYGEAFYHWRRAQDIVAKIREEDPQTQKEVSAAIAPPRPLEHWQKAFAVLPGSRLQQSLADLQQSLAEQQAWRAQHRHPLQSVIGGLFS